MLKKISTTLSMPGSLDGILLTLSRGLIGILVVRLVFGVLGPAGVIAYGNFQNILGVGLLFLCSPLALISNVIFSKNDHQDPYGIFSGLLVRAFFLSIPVFACIVYYIKSLFEIEILK